MRKPYDLAVRLALAQLALMVAIVAAFLVGSIVDTDAGDEINRHVDDVMDNAMPSVRYLTDARGELRGMETVLQRAVRSASSASAGSAEDALASDRRTMDGALTAYMALPFFPAEPALQREIADARGPLDDSISGTLAAIAVGNRALAQSSLSKAERATDGLDAALQRAVSFNAARAERIGRVMRAERRTLDRRTLLINVGLVSLALGATLLAIVTWRRSVAALEIRASELDMFAGRVAHDVLSPLMAVAMGLSLSKMRLVGDRAATATVERSERALDRVRELVTGLLEFARAGAGPAAGQTAGVREVVRGVLETVQYEATAAHIELRLEPGPESQAACAPGCIVSLVLNLVRNAIRHMGDAYQRLVTVRVRDAGPLVRVEVADTGPGIPEPIRKKLFQPFVRGTDAVPGVGLGLATVKRLAEGHGGRVGCASRAGMGSCFWFELPRIPAKHADHSERAGRQRQIA